MTGDTQTLPGSGSMPSLLHLPHTSALANPFPTCPSASSRPAHGSAHPDGIPCILCTLHFPPGPNILQKWELELEQRCCTVLSVEMETRLRPAVFRWSVWKCFPCKDSLCTWVCCLHDIFLFFLFSRFLSSFVSVLSFNMSPPIVELA